MGTITQKPTALHQHLCESCNAERFCDNPECKPEAPGITTSTCADCLKNPKTLLDLRRELMEGSNDLYQGFLASIVEQESLTLEQNEEVSRYLADPLAKRDRLADFILSMEEEAERLRGRVRMLEERSRQYEKVARMFRSSILAAFQNGASAKGVVVKANGSEHSFSVRANQLHVEIYDEKAIPGKFIEYTPVIKKREIADALSRGEEVPGARWADKTFSLQIR